MGDCKMKRLWIISLTLLVFSCGDKETTCDIKATLRDYTGLDGCGFALVIEEVGKKKEVLDLRSLSGWGSYGWGRIIFKDGMKVRISYEEMSDMERMCIVGTIVTITCMMETI
mgnify:FL=1